MLATGCFGKFNTSLSGVISYVNIILQMSYIVTSHQSITAMKLYLSERLDRNYLRLAFCVFLFFLFLFSTRFSFQETNFTVHALFTGSTATLFKKNIKNRLHSTIHTFKNYFITIFSIFSFPQNKLHPNGSVKQCIYEALALVLSKAFVLQYADAYDVQVVDQSNCWRVPVQVSSCGGTPAEMVQMGWLFPMQQNHVLAGKVSAGCSYAICNRMADRCLAVRKTLIKAIELGFCRLVSISSTGVEDLFLGRKVPWQLLVLIEDEIGECY